MNASFNIPGTSITVHLSQLLQHKLVILSSTRLATELDQPLIKLPGSWDCACFALSAGVAELNGNRWRHVIEHLTQHGTAQ